MNERYEWLAAAFDCLDQAGVPRKLQERVKDLLETWDDDAVIEAALKFHSGKVVASWSTPAAS